VGHVGREDLDAVRRERLEERERRGAAALPAVLLEAHLDALGRRACRRGGGPRGSARRLERRAGGDEDEQHERPHRRGRPAITDAVVIDAAVLALALRLQMRPNQGHKPLP
jgi:hypothetical protein